MQRLSSEPVKTFSIGFPVRRIRRDRATPAQVARAFGDASTTSFASSRDARRGAAEAGLALRRAVCRQLGDSHLLCLEADAPARHRGPDGRRRRRAVRRLSDAIGRSASAALVRPLAALAHSGRWRASSCSGWAGGAAAIAAAAAGPVCGGPELQPAAAVSGMGLDVQRGSPGRALQRRVHRPAARCRSRSISWPTAFARGPQARSGDRGQPGRSGHLSAVRLDDQSRHRLDGQQPGVPSPFLDYRVVELAAGMPLRIQAAWRARQADPARGLPRPAPRRSDPAAQDGIWRAPGPVW